MWESVFSAKLAFLVKTLPMVININSPDATLQ